MMTIMIKSLQKRKKIISEEDNIQIINNDDLISQNNDNNISDTYIISNEIIYNNIDELLEDYKRKKLSLLDRLLINNKFNNYKDIGY